MNYDKHEYYKNQHGVDLNEYLKSTLGLEQLMPWYMIQAVKYKVRAGKKTYNSYEEDMKKHEDYVREACDLLAMHRHSLRYDVLTFDDQNEIGTEIVSWIDKYVANFKNTKPE